MMPMHADTSRARTPDAAGIAARAGGVLVDAGIGLILLRGGPVWLLLIHPCVVALWFCGVWGCTRRWRPDGDHHRAGVSADQGKTIVLAAIALVLFPGFGLIGWSIAATLSALPARRRDRRTPVIPTDHEMSP